MKNINKTSLAPLFHHHTLASPLRRSRRRPCAPWCESVPSLRASAAWPEPSCCPEPAKVMVCNATPMRERHGDRWW